MREQTDHAFLFNIILFQIWFQPAQSTVKNALSTLASPSQRQSAKSVMVHVASIVMTPAQVNTGATVHNAQSKLPYHLKLVPIQYNITSSFLCQITHSLISICFTRCMINMKHFGWIPLISLILLRLEYISRSRPWCCRHTRNPCFVPTSCFVLKGMHTDFHWLTERLFYGTTFSLVN